MKSKLRYDRRPAAQSVLVSSTHLGLKTRFLFLSDSCVFVDMWRPLWRDDASVVWNCCRPPASTVIVGFRVPRDSRYILRHGPLITENTSVIVAKCLCSAYQRTHHGLHRKRISSIRGPLYSTGHGAAHRKHFLQDIFYCCVYVFRALPRNGPIRHRFLYDFIYKYLMGEK
jgi:hypothetical protein